MAALNHHIDVNHIACIHTSPWPTARDWPPLGRVVDGLIIVDQAQAAAAAGASGWPPRVVTIHFQTARPWCKRLRRRKRDGSQ